MEREAPIAGKTTPPKKRRRHHVLSVVLALCLAGAPEAARAATEYELKAIYLLNFAKSFDWPETAFPKATTPLVVGVLGNDPFGNTLTRVCRGETAGGHALQVRTAKTPAELYDCHIVFVSKSEASRTNSIVSNFSGRPILLIGDFSPFASKGGHLNFILKSGSVRYEFNAHAAQRNGLRIPSRIQRSGIPVSGR